jgi:hypothetical protein
MKHLSGEVVIHFLGVPFVFTIERHAEILCGGTKMPQLKSQIVSGKKT